MPDAGLMLGGMFSAPQQQPSRVDKIAAALMGFGAGARGRGQEYLSGLREEQQRLSQQRQQAMVRDAMAVDSLLANNRIDDALALTGDRVQKINELGGDPGDTLQVYDLLRTGNAQGARQMIGEFLGQAQQAGLIPGAQTIRSADLVDGELIQQDPLRGITRQRVAEPGASANMGLTPVWLQDQEGNYVPAQLSQGGGLHPVQVPEGMAAVPGAGQLGFDPNAIARRGEAQTGVEVERIQATTTPEAERAGAIRAAQEQAATEAVVPRAAAEQQADLAATEGQRTGQIQQSSQQLQLVNELLDEAAANASPITTGLGSLTRAVPGTPAANFSANLDTIRANIGFDKLQDLRANSPTGGALGAVSDRENQLLQSVFGSLDQSQSPQQFKQNVERVKRQVQESWQRVDDAYRRDYGIGYFEAEAAANRLIQAEDLFSQADEILRGSGL